MRNEGTALFNLVRNVGSSIGISTVQGLMVRNTQVAHAALAQHITPLTFAHHPLGGYAPQQAVAALNRAVTAQASMIAYIDDFKLMLILTVLALPLLLLVRNTRPATAEVTHAAIE
jgi:DHA2 family multidrug resistance protein